MWFTEYGLGTGLVGGVINPTTRVITEFPIVIPGVSEKSAEGITAGPHGNMWLSESEAGRVTEIDVNSHAITGFPAPASSDGPGPITLGPDGNLWFIDLSGNAIGEVSDSADVQPRRPRRRRSRRRRTRRRPASR